MREFGPYRILEELSRGGMGVVYRAERAGVERQVALKVISRGRVSAMAETRFWREAQAVARVQHPGVVRVHEVGEHEGQPFMAMELVEGLTLQERVDRDGPLPLDEARELACQLTEAVGAMHAVGLVHRDLKPDNVLLDHDGRVRLIDFGVVRDLELEQTRLTQSGALVGTPGYLAPEQAMGRRELVGPPTDVHGIGALLYFMLSGQPPYPGESLPAVLMAAEAGNVVPLSEVRPDAPAWVVQLCQRAMSVDPQRRFEDCDALLAALEEQPQRAGLPPGLLLAGVVVALLAALGVRWVVWGEPAPPPKGPSPVEVGPAPESTPESPPEPSPEATPEPPPEAEFDPPLGEDLEVDSERSRQWREELERMWDDRYHGGDPHEEGLERVCTNLLTLAQITAESGLDLGPSFEPKRRIVGAAIRAGPALAQLYHERRDHAGALRVLESIPKLAGSHDEVHGLRVQEHFDLGQWEGCERALEDYVATNGSDLRILTLGLRAVVRRGRQDFMDRRILERLAASGIDEGRRVVRWIRRLDAGIDDPAWAAVARGRLNDAERSFRERLASDPAGAELGLAAVARERWDFRGVYEHAEASLEHAPSAVGWALSAEGRYRTRDYLEGARRASRALASGEDPADWPLPAEPRLVRMRCSRYLGCWAQARFDGERAWAAEPRLEDWVRSMVHESASARLEELSRVDEPNLAQLYERMDLRLAFPELEHGDLGVDLTRISSHGVDPRRRVAGFVAAVSGRDTLEAFAHDAERPPLQRAKALRHLGLLEEAWQVLEVERQRFAAAKQREECDPVFEQVRTDAAYGPHPGLLDELQRAIDLAHNFPAAIAYKGELLRRLGRYAEAVAACDEALRREPKLATTSGLYPVVDRMLAHEQLGKLAEARRDAERALRSPDSYRQREAQLVLRRLK